MKRLSRLLFSFKAFAILLSLGLMVFLGNRLLQQVTVTTKDDLIGAGGLPSFPGAEGFGAQSVGGRGGRIIAVTNLNDSGSGSLREALEQSGPRIIIFKVSGYIKLNSNINLKNPYVTIAAQTAPGDGVALRKGYIAIATHDVIVRGLKYRVGDEAGDPQGKTRDGLNISASTSGQDVYNVIIDSSSISWSVDENASTWTNKIKNVTVQWSIIGEALNDSIHIDEGATSYAPHSMGFLIGDYTKNISVHHNAFVSNRNRNPLIQADTKTEVINNVIYNWGCEGTRISDSNNRDLPTYVHVIGNYYKKGPNTCSSRNGISIADNFPSSTKVYVLNNIGPGRESNSGDDWNAVTGNQSYRSNSPVFTSSGVTTSGPEEAYNKVLQYAGAKASNRDAVDSTLISNIKNNSGKIIDCVVTCDESTDIRNAQQGFPSMRTGSYPTDSDNDGIPNEWETQYNLDPQDSTDAVKLSPSGYMYIEEYVNSLISLPTSASAPSLTTAPIQTSDPIGTISYKDTTNATDWSLRSNIQVGDQMFGDRTYLITALPIELQGLQWIRSAADSKLYTSSPLVSFPANRTIEVYVAIDNRAPALTWLSGWTDTGKDMNTYALNTDVSFSIYKRTYSGGQTVSIGPIGNNLYLPYPIIIKPL